jgi:hypothetical protein
VATSKWWDSILAGAGVPRTGSLDQYTATLFAKTPGNVPPVAAYAASIGQTISDVQQVLKSNSVYFQDSSTLRRFLDGLGVPGFAVGTNYVPHDMLAQIHQGEAIIPAPFNPAKYGKDSGNDALVAEIKALRAQVESLQKSTEAGQNAIAANTRKTATVLTKFDIDGLPATRT